MKIVNSITGTEPYFFHAQGKSHKDEKWVKLVNTIVPQETMIQIPDIHDITIITFMYGNQMSSFDRQLKKAGVPFVNLAEYYGHTGLWQNKWKIIYTERYLKEVKTPYVLISDAIDVLACDNWTGMIEKFEVMNCDILFAAMKTCYPKEVPDVEDENSQWAYLAAGNTLAKTEPLKEFYRVLVEACITDDSKLVNNEQGILRVVRRGFDNIKADTNCEIFSTVLGFDYSLKDNVVTIHE